MHPATAVLSRADQPCRFGALSAQAEICLHPTGWSPGPR